MGWCLECKVEYVEGMTNCADCGCALAEELPEEGKEAVFTSEELLMRLAAGEEFSGEEIAGEELGKRVRQVAAQKMADQMRSTAGGFYRNHDERAQEHKSSAYTLLLVGGVGMAGVVLFFLDVFSISTTSFGKYMITGVMGVTFLLFLVMGVVSMKNSRVLEKKAGKENNLTREIKHWCFENIRREDMDNSLFQSEESAACSEEIKYFRRSDRMKEMLENQFMNLEEGYLERLIDEVYPEIFESLEAKE